MAEMRNVKISMLDDGDLQRIHDYSMKLLRENGIQFHSERAVEIFKKHGFKVSGNQVYMTEQQVRVAIETAPSHFIIRGRDSKKSLNLGGGDFGVPGPIGPVYVTDIDNGQRRGTLKDVENLIKIYHASKVMTMNSNNGVEANDVDINIRHLSVMRALLNNTDKPFYTKLFDYEQMHQAIDMVEIAIGEKLKPGGNIYMSSGSCPSLSPLTWSAVCADAIIALSERGQVVTTGTATSTGITGPVRLFGTLVVQNAELISGIVLSQLVNPGNPVGYGTAATSGNMRGAKYCCGSPTRLMLQVGSIEMGKRYYNLPSRALTYGTDSTCPDVQMGIESYENVIGPILSGGDYMLSEIGTLDGLQTTSYEKTIIDEEITSRLFHIKRGIDVSEDAASMDVILEIGSGGEYITSKDTLEHFGEEWYPSVSDWNANNKSRPDDDYSYLLRRANAEWKRRLAEAPDSLLDDAVSRELDRYIELQSKF
ncbi:MAG: trimethylamine methyltransferase family protein [Dehalobacterium sp.]